MTDPANVEDFMERFHKGEKLTGYGIDNVHMTSPCPFCAAPDWMTWDVLDVRAAMTQGATCKECGRSAKAIFADAPGSISFELVQTGGNDPPDYLVPKIRRV
jgi:hypothetical protein